MNRKGSIMPFIIMGIVILILIGIFISVSNESKIKPIEKLENINSKPVIEYVDNCVKDTTIPVLYDIATQSGYLYLPGKRLDTDYSSMSYYYDNKKVNMPSIEEIEVQVQDYVNKELWKCLNWDNFNSYNVQGDKYDTKITFGEKEVNVKLDMPIKISSGNNNKEINSFNIKIPIRMKHLWKISNDIVKMIAQDPLWLDFTALSDYDVDVNILPYNRSVMVFSLTDSESSINNDPFIYLFAVEYKVHNAPEIYVDDVFNLIDNQNFEYNITSNQEVTFSDNTPMFDIVDGLINFTPLVTGEFNVIISAENKYGLDTTKEVKVIVKDSQ